MFPVRQQMLNLIVWASKGFARASIGLKHEDIFLILNQVITKIVVINGSTTNVDPFHPISAF